LYERKNTNCEMNTEKESISDSQWTMVIKPKRGLFEIDVREIWSYKDLIELFVRRDFVARFKQTILGPLWFLIGPLLSTFVYFMVFNSIAKISTDGAPPILFYLSGIVAWNYFAACLNGTSGTFAANAGIFGKVYFPRLVSPIATIISNLVQFGIQFLLLLGVLGYYGLVTQTTGINLTALLIPIYLLILAMIGFGTGIIISALTTKYRDLVQLMSFGVQLWMYATPIIYPVSMVPENFRIFVMLNPVAPLVEAFKYSLLGTGNFNLAGLMYSCGFAIFIVLVGILLFNKVEQTFMDTV